MKYTFQLCYEMDHPMAVSVAMYLDCEHYTHLHEKLTSHIEVLESGPNFYICRQKWDVFGIPVGQTYRCTYVPPATFCNTEVRPYPWWIPSIYHLIGIRTTLRYFETEARTTLSELTVEMDLPFFLYPFRRFLRHKIEKVKVVKDLEDVMMMERRARLFGRDFNDDYLASRQFMLNKESYASCFGKKSAYFGPPLPEELEGVRWPDIRTLDRPYVREFLADYETEVDWLETEN